MSDNWEFALENVTDGYVTVIGDDDGLSPDALEKVNSLINLTGAEAIRSNGCVYEWPSLNRNCFGRLVIEIGAGYKIVNSSEILQSVLSGRIAYDQLPMIYTGGFVKMEVLQTIKKLSNRYFLSMVPDIYSGIAIASVIDKYVLSSESLAIAGASHHSTGTSTLVKSNSQAENSPKDKFFSEKNIPFHQHLSIAGNTHPVRSLPVIIYESYLQASSLHKFNRAKIDDFEILVQAISRLGPDKNEVLDWACAFAKNNNLDLQAASKSAASQQKLSGILEKLVNSIYRNISTYIVIGNVGCPLHDVYQASIVAGAMKTQKSRFNVSGLILKMRDKIFRPK